MTTMTRYAAGTFCWTELGTTDQDGAKKFYPALFGWTYEDTPIGDGQTYTMLKKDGQEIGALYRQDKGSDHGLGPNWMPYVAVDNADTAADKVKQSGGKVLVEPFDVMEHGRMATCQDPTGGIFSLWQAKKHVGATLVGEADSMVWNELITTDTDKAGNFYRQIFGWTEESMPALTGGTYTTFNKDGAGVGGMLKATPEMKLTHPYWMVYFAVDDCDKTAAKVQQLGGKVMLQPTTMASVGRLAVLTDPQGAFFAIIKPDPNQT